MAVKTITVTDSAYEALRSLKKKKESFSETILRVANRRSLSEFFGVLSKESGERLEKAIYDMRKERNKAHEKRIMNIVKELNER